MAMAYGIETKSPHVAGDFGGMATDQNGGKKLYFHNFVIKGPV